MKAAIVATLVGAAAAQQTAWGQCGGNGWKGATTCVSGYYCHYQNDYYSQCIPGTASTTTTAKPPSSTARTTTVAGPTTIRTTTTTTTRASSTSTKPSSTPTAPAGGKVRFAGVNIAGFDFGCGTDGTCVTTQAYNIVRDGTALAQMQHFIRDDKLNTFRLPVGWQWLVNNNLGGTLDATNFAAYDSLVQGCLNAGASLCIIDIHNYARWNGAIIGQGGPTNAQFASVWSQLAAKYKGESRIAFGIMNEPHDVPSITTWAASVQAAVTAIRQAGATSQYILLPGNDYTSAEQFISNGSGAALLTVKDLDGTTSKLIFDVHKYLDSDNSGTHAECVKNNIANAFQPLATWLRSNGRMAFNSETGGGNVASCVQYLCQQLQFLNQNSDVYLGYTGWSAGGFDSTYVLSETPNGNTDTSLVSQCIVGAWHA